VTYPPQSPPDPPAGESGPPASPGGNQPPPASELSYPPPGGYEPPASGYPQPTYPSPAPDQPPPGAYPPAGGYEAAPPAPFGQLPYGALVLPPGTQLSSIGKRIGAYFLGILLFIVTLAIGYIIWSLIVWTRGQTPEKQILHMRVYRIEDRRAAKWGWMFVRQVLGGIVEGIIPAGVVVSFVVMCISNERRAIHDYIAGTVVVDDPNDVLAPR
jgi:uncharacterized RDD family membrane protein YckC